MLRGPREGGGWSSGRGMYRPDFRPKIPVYCKDLMLVDPFQRFGGYSGGWKILGLHIGQVEHGLCGEYYSCSYSYSQSGFTNFLGLKYSPEAIRLKLLESGTSMVNSCLRKFFSSTFEVGWNRLWSRRLWVKGLTSFVGE